MKDSTPRKKEKEREIKVVEKSSHKATKTPLRLITSERKSVFDKQQAMAEKIWEDLIENYKFMDENSESSSAKDLQQGKHVGRKVNLSEPVPGTNDRKKSTHGERYRNFDYTDLEYISEEHLRFTKAVQLSQSFVLIVDRQGIIEYANPHFQNISGYTQDELVGKELGILISDLASHEEYEQIKQALNAGISWKGDLVKTKKNGDWYIVSTKISPINNPYGEVVDYIIVGHDVTSFRETEIKLEQAVEDKTILLSELHHRVKNNLAIISGIMQLQALEEDDDYLRGKLFSSVGRVKTLATVHELLYESSSFTMLEFGNNIQKIVQSVAEMFETKTNKVEVEYELESVILNINQAHPCALILNEVITNTYKKAIEHPEIKPRLSISLSTFGKKIYIEIKDNLNSIPEAYSSGNKPLSLQLIDTLSKQLYGKYNYLSHDRGTLFTLTFKKVNIRGTGNGRL